MPVKNQDKVARICWNTEGWVKPSGRLGKSKNKDAYELLYGYGHEEWLLDTSKLISGYHYAYLQAIGQHREKYTDSIYNISIYSINNQTKQRWWIGTINNVKVIDIDESKRVFKAYKENGWYDEMLSQLRNVDADINEFKRNVKADWFAVIKFKPSDLSLLDEPLEFYYGDPAVTSDYYNLKNKVGEPDFPSLQRFVFQSGHNDGKHKAIMTYDEHTKEVDLFHNKIQSKIYEQLVEIHGEKNVGTENNAGIGNRIDLVVKNREKYTFYELKTGRSARKCIREAFGQLIEYSMFRDIVNVDKLIIISTNAATPEISNYLTRIRNAYSIPIYYQYFNSEKFCLEGDLI